MIRTYNLVSDNVPTNGIFTVEIDTGLSAHPYYTLETGTPVTWAIVTSSNVEVKDSDAYFGPYNFTPIDAVSEYDIQSALITNDSGMEFVPESLMVYYNGQLLKLDQEYSENADRHNFEFIDVGTTGLPELPDSNENLTVVFKRYIDSVPSSSGSVYIPTNGLYPYMPTGIKVLLSDFSHGDSVQLNIIYR